MADGIADVFLAAGEPVPAPAPLRQTFHRAGGQLLRLGRRPAGTLMTRLPALLARFTPLALQLFLRALTRELTALLTRQGWIRRRRHRTVQRRLILLALKLQDTLPQPGHLINRPGDLIQHVKQPDHQLARRLPASQRDRFSIRSMHARKIPSNQKESCSPPRHHLNAYPGLWQAHRGHAACRRRRLAVWHRLASGGGDHDCPQPGVTPGH
ncbi:MAG: hypothetical protein ACRDNK_13650, partial [Solirubrobacteraceae bacterium]